ncbi:hypothetical protein EVAR_13631_1 [Eumeta japonica]|uniref:Uncharacterized protein n=1 Tax=Eumeta variegata TaxID=151549 RepID=A0A4C1UTE8_EUMVA|nr:hypothetical protein EVAR_13631_1 [Eumeta japonica]
MPPASSKSELSLVAKSKLDKGRGTESRIGSGSESKAGPGMKIENRIEVENECGFEIRVKIVIKIRIEDTIGMKLTSIDKKGGEIHYAYIHAGRTISHKKIQIFALNTKDERIHSTSMLAELRALTGWASNS